MRCFKLKNGAVRLIDAMGFLTFVTSICLQEVEAVEYYKKVRR